ncbi:MAG: hypothetical protein AAFO95_20890 [Cyanobacteria bacterium J06600_6]
MINPNYAANFLGIFSLLTFAIAISPTLIKLLKLPNRHKRAILRTGRYGLLSSVCLGLTHGLLMTQQDNLNFYDLNTYWVFAGGLFAFNLLVFFAFMYSELRSDSKKLSYFSYAALLLLAIHLGQQIIL